MSEHTHRIVPGLIPGPGVCPACDAAERVRLSGPLPALDPADAEMVADELRALGWSVSPPDTCPRPGAGGAPSWLVERGDGDGFEMLGGGRDE